MMKMMLRSMLVLCSFLVLAGCGDEDPGITVEGVLTDFGTGNAVAGANVCLGDSDECVVTDAEGVYTFVGVPSGSQEFFTITATGYLPSVLPMMVTADAMIDTLLLSDGVIAAFELAIMDEFEPATGYLAAGSFTPMGGVEGATYTASPAGTGPIYLGAPGLPDATLTEQSVAGRAGWVDLPPGGNGEVTLIPPAGVTCTRPPLAWPGSSDLSQAFPIRAGHIVSSHNFNCE